MFLVQELHTKNTNKELIYFKKSYDDFEKVLYGK